MPVAEDPDVLEKRRAGRRLCMGRLASEQFTLQGGEEALGHGVVLAVAHRGPIERRMPTAWRRTPKSGQVYREPWSEWRIAPASGRRLPTATASAATTRSVRRRSAMAQPTTRRLDPARITAR